MAEPGHETGHESEHGSDSLGWSPGHVLDRGLGVLVSKDCPVSAAQGPRRFRIQTPVAPRPPLPRQWEERLSAYNPSTVVLTH